MVFFTIVHFYPSTSDRWLFFMIEKETFMSKEINSNDLYVVVISSKEERDELKAICVKLNIPIIYPELFEEEEIHHLWGISKSGVALVGTIIARNTPKDHIIHSLKELESYLS